MRRERIIKLGNGTYYDRKEKITYWALSVLRRKTKLEYRAFDRFIEKYGPQITHYKTKLKLIEVTEAENLLSILQQLRTARA